MVLGPFAETKGPRPPGRDPAIIIQDGMSEMAIPIERVLLLPHMFSPSPYPLPQGRGGSRIIYL